MLLIDNMTCIFLQKLYNNKKNVTSYRLKFVKLI